MNESPERKIRVVIDLEVLDHGILTALVKRTGLTESQIVADALRNFIGSIPRLEIED